MLTPTNNYWACFQRHLDNGKTVEEMVPVFAFDEDGRPLVVDRDRLGAVTTVAGKGQLAEIVYEPQPTIIPGGGWMVTWTSDDGTRRVEPILAWRLYPVGSSEDRMFAVKGDPIGVGPDGEVDVITLVYPKETGVIWHPDQTGKPEGS